MRFTTFSLLVTMLSSLVAHARVVENEHGLVIEMQIQEIDLTSKEGLRILTAGTGTNGEFGIILRVPTGDLDRWPLGNKNYKFPVLIDAANEQTRQALDKILIRKFGKGAPQTIFKPHGYSASSPHAPAELKKRGGAFYLADPSVDGGITWNIKFDLNAKNQTLVLEVSPASF